MTRLFPIVLSEGFIRLPPTGVEETAITATLWGWYPSHIMALLSVPLLVSGFATVNGLLFDAHARTAARAAGSGGIALIVAGLGLYLVAAVLDGVALGHIADHYRHGTPEEQHLLALAMSLLHETAVSFGGHFMALVITGTGLLGAGLALHRRGRLLSWSAVAIGGVGLIGLLSGAFDLSFQERFPLLAGTVGLTMVWWLSLAFAVWNLSEPAIR